MSASSRDETGPRSSARLLSPGTWAWERLFAPVDAASLAVFRIVFGGLMVWEVWRYWTKGWIAEYFVKPTFFFRFPYFEWLPAPSAEVAYGLWLLMAVGAAGVMLGWYYRVGAFVMTSTFAYFFLLDASNYLNHFYLICLLGCLMTVIPAHRIWSVDAWRTKSSEQTVPAWTIWLLRLQIGLPYFYAGVAKIDRDWLLGIPMQHMLLRNVHLPVVGRYLTEWWVADLFAFGGLLFDLLVFPALLWKRTRLLAFLCCLAFHLTNKLLLNIGIFPWMMIGATTLFFDPDWPRRLPGFRRLPRPVITQLAAPMSWTRQHRWVVVGVGIWTLLQFGLPLRHYFYATNTNWTEEGHRFAWRMKLRSKEGSLAFYLVDPKTGEVAVLDPSPYVMPRQFAEMAQHPDMILQFARFLGEQLEEIGFGDQEVRAEAWCSLNAREPQLMVDPEVDLSREVRGQIRASWILPLEEPRGPRQDRALEVVRDLRRRLHSSSPP